MIADLLAYYIRVQAVIIVFVLVVAFVFRFIKKPLKRAVIAVCLGFLVLILHVILSVYARYMSWTPMNLINLLVLNQLPALSLGFSLVGMRTLRGFWRLTSIILALVTLLDIVIIISHLLLRSTTQ